MRRKSQRTGPPARTHRRRPRPVRGERASGIATRSSSAASHNRFSISRWVTAIGRWCPCSSRGGDPKAVCSCCSFGRVRPASGCRTRSAGCDSSAISLPRPSSFRRPPIRRTSSCPLILSCSSFLPATRPTAATAWNGGRRVRHRPAHRHRAVVGEAVHRRPPRGRPERPRSAARRRPALAEHHDLAGVVTWDEWHLVLGCWYGTTRRPSDSAGRDGRRAGA